MSSQTTNYSIFYPVASDSIAPLHTAFTSLANSVDSALTTHLKPLVDNVDNYNYSVNDVSAMNAIVSPPAGSTAFITATKARYYYDGGAWVLLYLPWTTYTPVLTTNGTTAITGWDLTDKGRYMVINKTVFIQIAVSVTTAQAAGAFTALNVSLPTDVIPSATYNTSLPVGHGAFAKGDDRYPLIAYHVAPGYVKLRYYSGTKAISVATTGGTNPAAFAVGNSVVLNLSYSL